MDQTLGRFIDSAARENYGPGRRVGGWKQKMEPPAGEKKNNNSGSPPREGKKKKSHLFSPRRLYIFCCYFLLFLHFVSFFHSDGEFRIFAARAQPVQFDRVKFNFPVEKNLHVINS